MKSDMDISKLQPKLIDLPGADDGGSIFVMAKLFPASVAHCHRSRDVCNVAKGGTSRLIVRIAPEEGDSIRRQFGEPFGVLPFRERVSTIQDIFFTPPALPRLRATTPVPRAPR